MSGACSYQEVLESTLPAPALLGFSSHSVSLVASLATKQLSQNLCLFQDLRVTALGRFILKVIQLSELQHVHLGLLKLLVLLQHDRCQGNAKDRRWQALQQAAGTSR